MTEPPAPSPLPTLRQEFQVVGLFTAIVMVIMGLAGWAATGPSPDSAKPLAALGGLATLFGNAMWVSMDRRRRGKEVGAWRFAAILLGPFALCVYIVLEYRARAILYIPALAAVYATGWVLPVVIAGLIRHFGA